MRRARLSFQAFALVLVVVTMSVARRAVADDTPGDRATIERRAGDAAMNDARAADAIPHYRAAYELAPDPALLYNLARAYMSVGDAVNAADNIEAFDRDAPAPMKSRVPGLKQMLAEARQRVGELEVVCNVEWAEVRLGDRALGKTPLSRVRVAAGDAVLHVERDGYVPFSSSVKVPPGETAHVEVALTLVPKVENSLLVVRSSTPGAHVFLDGTARGDAPTEAWVKPGEHELRVSRDGYDTEVRHIDLRVGEQRALDVPLHAQSSSILGRWWFWTAIGAVAIGGGVATYVALHDERHGDSGDIAPGRVTVNGFHF